MQKASVRAKGKSLEKEVGALLGRWWQGAPFPRSHGSGSAATLMKIAGLCETGDLYTCVDFPFSVECKNQEEWNLEAVVSDRCKKLALWWKQACGDARKSSRIPMLCFSRNKVPIFVAVPATIDSMAIQRHWQHINTMRVTVMGESLVICTLAGLLAAPKRIFEGIQHGWHCDCGRDGSSTCDGIHSRNVREGVDQVFAVPEGGQGESSTCPAYENSRGGLGEDVASSSIG
jgi:hypothetical protein